MARSVRLRPVPIVLLAMLLSGCVDPPPSDEEPAAQAQFDTDLFGPLTNGVPTGWAFDADAGLVQATNTTPAPFAREATIPLGWSWGEYVQGIEPKAWTGEAIETGSFGAGLLITSATITLTLEASGPAASTLQRPQVTAWFGTTEATYDHIFIDGPVAMTPGERIEFEHEIRLPPGGFVLPYGAPPMIRVATYYTDGTATEHLSLVVGVDEDGDAWSDVAFEATPIALPETQLRVIADEDITLTGGRCAIPGDPDSRATAVFPVPVDADTASLHVRTQRTGGEGMVDLDVLVYDGEGTFIVEAGSPTGDEGMDLYLPNIQAGAPGDWEVHVFACGPQNATAEVLVLDGVQADAPSEAGDV